MLEVKNVFKSYKKPDFFTMKRNMVLHDVSFSMDENECLGIIGESGSGKSTLSRLILGIEAPDRGEVLINRKSVKNRRERKGIVSAVFQDYTSSINPSATVHDTILESMQISKTKFNRQEAIELLNKVGLSEDYLYRHPHELSGGEVQRVCIARAIASKPMLIVLDEAISSLDASIQVTILDLLKNLKKEYNLSYLFITHDIQAAVYICDKLIIFKDGKIVEKIKTEDIKNVKEDYSKQLFNAVLAV